MEELPYIGLGLTNFQSIKKAKFRFPVGITAIIGPSGSGKTAIFRAIRATILNPPQAKTYIHYGETLCSVGMRIPGLPLIGWVKKRDEVMYKIGDDLRTKLGKKGLHAVIPDFPFPLEEETGRLMNFHGEHDILFPYAYTPSQLFRLYEDVFDIVDSAKVVKKIRENEEGMKIKAERHREIAEDADKRVKIIESESKDLTVELVDKYLNALTVTRQRQDELLHDLKIARRIGLLLKDSEGLEQEQFEWSIMQMAMETVRDYCRTKNLQRVLTETEGLATVELDWSLVEKAGDIGQDLVWANHNQVFLERTEGLEPLKCEWGLVEESLKLMDVLKEAGRIWTKAWEMMKEEERMTAERNELKMELEKF